MINGCVYELIKGTKSVGQVRLLAQPRGASVTFYEVSMLKQKYNSKPRTIEVPIRIQQISDDGVYITFQRYLDVSKKSRRQINLILKGWGSE